MTILGWTRSGSDGVGCRPGQGCFQGLCTISLPCDWLDGTSALFLLFVVEIVWHNIISVFFGAFLPCMCSCTAASEVRFAEKSTICWICILSFMS
jgi:hypothetical protein